MKLGRWLSDHWVTGVGVLVLAYLFLPIAVVVGLSFNEPSSRLSYDFNEFTLDNWTNPCGPGDMCDAVVRSVQIGFIATVGATMLGTLMAFALVRHRFRGRALLNAAVDLPFAVSPVVIGLALILVYGRREAVGGWLFDNGIQVIFSPVGMVLATMFVSLPFVVREVVPVLQEIGTEQEQAASTLGASRRQTFLRVTLPAIRWGVAYGVILTTARALGEFGAVSVVSGKLAGRTETLTLRVEERFQAFDLTGAYAASIVLALMALATLLLMNLLQPKEESR
jgi:sulfate transport system permease protein